MARLPVVTSRDAGPGSRSGGSPLRCLVRTMVADVGPLRASADYRRLWFGLTVSHPGQQMTAVAVALQVFAITGSSFSVGLVGLCAFLPLMLSGPYGGAVVDAVDRRRVGLVTAARHPTP